MEMKRRWPSIKLSTIVCSDLYCASSLCLEDLGSDELYLRTEPLDQYLRSFSWNKVKYRADKPLAELIDLLQKV